VIAAEDRIHLAFAGLGGEIDRKRESASPAAGAEAALADWRVRRRRRQLGLWLAPQMSAKSRRSSSARIFWNSSPDPIELHPASPA
jgi:hypothetical protein